MKLLDLASCAILLLRSDQIAAIIMVLDPEDVRQHHVHYFAELTGT